MSDAIISVADLGKRYTLGSHGSGEHYTALRDVITEKARSLFHRPRSVGASRSRTDVPDFWALKEISFEVERGEVIGIVGRNGAGKSTLLKILSRITEPTEGRVRIKGRVASLLEVGTGFHPELTGRENVYLNGAILGMSRAEIQKKFDEIVAFAEVEQFLDTPVKRYSSGMYVRLAFAVAAHLEPEILIVDEVLAVGDAAFQQKCIGKMKDVAGHGRTVLFVSHNMAAVGALCSRAILLQSGRVVMTGAVSEVIGKYLEHGRAGSGTVSWAEGLRPGTDGFELISLALTNAAGESKAAFVPADGIQVEAHFRSSRELQGLRFGILLRRSDGVVVAGSNNPDVDTVEITPPGEYSVCCRLSLPLLNEGSYDVAVGFDEYPYRTLLCLTDYLLTFAVEDVVGHGVKKERLPGVVRLPLEWSRVRPPPQAMR